LTYALVARGTSGPIAALDAQQRRLDAELAAKRVEAEGAQERIDALKKRKDELENNLAEAFTTLGTPSSDELRRQLSYLAQRAGLTVEGFHLSSFRSDGAEFSTTVSGSMSAIRNFIDETTQLRSILVVTKMHMHAVDAGGMVAELEFELHRAY
jgi:hypothetical protein